MAYGETRDEVRFLGRVDELEDFNSLNPETLRRLQAIIDEAFGRKVQGPWQTSVLSLNNVDGAKLWHASASSHCCR